MAIIAGPSIGGIVYALGEPSSGGADNGAQWVYGVAAGLLVLAVAMMLLVPTVTLVAVMDRSAK